MRQCVNGCGEGRVELMGAPVCWECYSKWISGWSQSGEDIFKLRGYVPPPIAAKDQCDDSQLQIFGGAS